MKNMILAKIGRPSNEEIENYFMKELKKKSSSIDSQSNLQAALLHDFFSIIKKPQKKKKCKTKLDLKTKVGFELTQLVNIELLLLEQKEMLYHRCQFVSKTFKFEEFDLDSMPQYLFIDQKDLSFIFHGFMKQKYFDLDSIRVQQLIFIAIYCFRQKIIPIEKFIEFLNSRMGFIIDGVTYSLTLIKDRLLNGQKKQNKLTIGEMQIDSEEEYQINNEEPLGIISQFESVQQPIQQEYLESLQQSQVIQQQYLNQQQNNRTRTRRSSYHSNKSRQRDIKNKKIKNKANKKIRKIRKQKMQSQAVLSEEQAKKICIHFINYISYSLYYILEEPNNCMNEKRSHQNNDLVHNLEIKQDIYYNKIQNMGSSILTKNNDSIISKSEIQFEKYWSQWNVEEIFQECGLEHL